MFINSYDFGKIKIDGQEYTQDVIIYPDKVFCPWWRKQGHALSLEDLPRDLLEQKPAIVIIGTGYSGLMEVSSEVKDYLRKLGIEVIIEPTIKAWQKYNQLSQSKKVIALFHLTC